MLVVAHCLMLVVAHCLMLVVDLGIATTASAANRQVDQLSMHVHCKLSCVENTILLEIQFRQIKFTNLE